MYSEDHLSKHYVFTADECGPKIGINAGSHGNETTGIDVVRALIDSFSKEIKLIRGELILTFGNPRAILLDERFAEVDLNRCFGQKPPEGFNQETYEWQRAQELKTIWGEGVDYLFDLHATIHFSNPFLVAPDLFEKVGTKRDEIIGILSLLNFSRTLTGEGLYPPSGDSIYADTYMSQKGGVGITIEAGWLKTPNLESDLRKKLKAILAYLGMIEGDCTVPEFNPEFLNVYKNVIATPGFTWSKEWGNFELVEEGCIFAQDNNGPIAVDRPTKIIFPKKEPIVGQEACLLGETLQG